MPRLGDHLLVTQSEADGVELTCVVDDARSRIVLEEAVALQAVLEQISAFAQKHRRCQAAPAPAEPERRRPGFFRR